MPFFLPLPGAGEEMAVPGPGDQGGRAGGEGQEVSVSVSSALRRVSVPGQVVMELLCHFTAACFSTVLGSLLPPHPDPSGHFAVLGFSLVALLWSVSVGFSLFCRGRSEAQFCPL